MRTPLGTLLADEELQNQEQKMAAEKESAEGASKSKGEKGIEKTKNA